MTLKEIEEKYAQSMRLRAAPISYGEYVRTRVGEYNDTARKRGTAVLGSYARGSTDYGSTAERLEGLGLGSSGYASYLKKKSEASTRTALADIESDRYTAEASAKRDYLGYLADYNEKQDKLRRSVVDTLRRNRELNVNEIYRYAAEQGLTAKKAQGLYTEVYNSLRGTLKNEIMAQVYRSELPPEMAAAYARRIGLNENDVREIEQLSVDFHDNFAEYSKEYIDYLESLGNKTTPSYGG